MPWKNFDYVHYLNNHELQKSQLLQPIFEAVQNAFQSVDDRNSGGAYVEVVIDRDDTQATIDFPEVGDRIGSAPDVSTVQIVDLGLGFTDSNWDAFETISTSHRKEHGGKGMGRLLYCVPFRKVEFDSVYDDDGKLRRRTFDLSRRIKGTSRPKVTDAATDDESKTSVTFVKPTAELKSVFPKSAHALARKFVKHFFKRLSMEKDGRFFVTDKWSGERVDVVQLCHDEFILEQSTEDVRILKRQYQLTHVRLRRNVGKRHEVLLCGQGRLVRTLDLGPALVWLRRAISHADGAFYYAGFLEGKVLDGALQEERLSFNLPENLETDDDEFEFGEDPSKPSIDRLVNDVAKHAKTFLRDYVSKIEDAHWKRIQEFCGKNPVFRPLLSHKKADLLAVPEHLPDEPFAEAIGAIYHRWKTETKQRFKALSASVRANKSAQDQYMASYRDALKELNELAFYELAEYVVDRKAVIDFLWDRMKQAESGKFFDEDAVHDIFFPRKATTSDIDWDESQLWLIDERLMLQSFVASDLPLNQHQTLDTREVDRPDLAVYHDTAFDAAYAFGEGPRTTFTAVTIVEFKRPGRDNYGEDENPIRQVIKYIRKIRAAKAKQVDGHVLRICDASPIHVYVVCHIVDSLLEHMGEYQYVQTQDGQGILMHAPKLNAFIQVITFEKLIEDARTRHESFFRKLGLPEF